MTLWMVCMLPEEAMFEIWCKSVKFEGIKNTFKDGWNGWRFEWSWWWFWCSWLGLLSWLHHGWSANALRELWLKFGWILLSLKASRTLSEMDDIALGLEDAGHSWLELVSLMTLWMVYKRPEGVMFKIWLKSHEFEGIVILFYKDSPNSVEAFHNKLMSF